MQITRVRTTIAALCLIVASAAAFARAQNPTESPHQLVKDVVWNELQGRQQEGYWQYRIDKRTGQRTVTEEQVDTPFGPVFRVLAREGKPLTRPEQERETRRLERLLHDPSEQARAKEEHEADQERVERLMHFMPDAFLYSYAGMDGENLRLKFEPNPKFNPPTYESRIFHSLAGTILVAPGPKRLVRIDGKIIDRVEFGFGLLGHVDKGGTFVIGRKQVSATQWRTNLVDVDVSGRIILFKTISKNEREVRSEFKRVPQNLTVAQAVTVLNQFAGSLQAMSSPRR